MATDARSSRQIHGAHPDPSLDSKGRKGLICPSAPFEGSGASREGGKGMSGKQAGSKLVSQGGDFSIKSISGIIGRQVVALPHACMRVVYAFTFCVSILLLNFVFRASLKVTNYPPYTPICCFY
jgi:hypothetical protein